MTYKIYVDGEVRDATPEEAAEFDRAKEQGALQSYRFNRAAEYPPILDYLDGVVKGDQAQVQAYIDACLAVKAKYPKSE